MVECVASSCIPGPLLYGEGSQHSELAGEQEEVESSVQEEPLWKAAPVHCPLVEELPTQVK